MNHLDELSPKHIDILRHTVGADNMPGGEFYRNRFVTGVGSDDHPICKDLVERRLMLVHYQPMLLGGSDLFWLTEAGKAVVRQDIERQKHSKKTNAEAK